MLNGRRNVVGLFKVRQGPLQREARLVWLPRTDGPDAGCIRSRLVSLTIPKLSFKRFCCSFSGGDRFMEGATDYICHDVNRPVLLRMEDTAPGNVPPILVQTMLRKTVAKYPDHLALSFMKDGTLIEMTYKETYDAIQTVAKGFIAAGLKERKGVGIIGNNCAQWLLSTWGSIFAGGLSCGIYTTSSAEVVKYVCENSENDILVVDDLNLLKKLLESKQTLKQLAPVVSTFILMNSTEKELLEAKRLGNILSWKELETMGKATTDAELDLREARQYVNMACMYIYTSGTIGDPKGALISHDNITFAAMVSMNAYQWSEGKQRVVSYLPFSHVVAHMVDCFFIFQNAGSVFIADKDCLKGTMVDNLKMGRPTKFAAVPRVWEKIRERLEEVESEAGFVKKVLIAWARRVAYDRHQKFMKNSTDLTYGDWQYKLAHRLVLGKVHRALGLERTLEWKTGRVTGGAPLRESTKEFFASMGLFLSDLYGSTETTGPITCILEKEGWNKQDTVGRAFQGVNVKLLDQDPQTGEGEVAVGSRNVCMGYAKEEAKTIDAFTDDRWFKTGDLAIVQDGFYKITGRKKEIIITEGGKNVAPVPIEDRLKSELNDLISHVVVIGDQRKFLVCLLTLRVTVDPATGMPLTALDGSARGWCKAAVGDHPAPRTVQEFCHGPGSSAYFSRVKAVLEMVNLKADFKAQQLQGFHILPEELSISGGELGPTLKLRRSYIMKKYEKEIDALYSSILSK